MMFYCHLHSNPFSHVIPISEARLARVSEGALSSVNRSGFPWIRNGSSLLLNPGKWGTGISTCSWRALWVVTSGFAGWSRLSLLERYVRLAVLYLGQPWEQLAARLFELWLNIGCQGYFMGHWTFTTDSNQKRHLRQIWECDNVISQLLFFLGTLVIAFRVHLENLG